MDSEQNTSVRILEAASGLFGERGYAGTTTRAIAERAGVNEVTVFRRFKNKRGVLSALAESWAKGMAGFAVHELPDPADTRATLLALADLEVTQAAHMGAAALRLALDATTISEVREVMGDGPGANFAGLAEYLSERQRAGDLREDLDPQVMAEAFFALTSQMVMARQVVDPADRIHGVPMEQAARQGIEILLTGVMTGAKR